MALRKNTTIRQRLRPCDCCGYPLSECHHLVPVAGYGPNNMTVPLCPNCHDLFHIAFAAKIDKSKRARRLWGSVILKSLNKPFMETIYKISELVRRSHDIQIELSIEAARLVESQAVSNHG